MHPGLVIAALGAAWANRLRGPDPSMDDPTLTDFSGPEDDRHSMTQDRQYPPANPFDKPKAPAPRPSPGGSPSPRISPNPGVAPAKPVTPAKPKKGALKKGAVIDPTRCPRSQQWPAQGCQNTSDWRSTGRGGASQFKRSYFGKEPPMSQHIDLGSSHYSHLGGVAAFGRRPSTVILPGGREMFMDNPKEGKKKRQRGKVSVNVAFKKGGWKKMEQRAAKRAIKVLEAEGYDVNRVLRTTLVIIPATPIGPVPFLYKGWAVAKVVAKATYYED